MSHSFLAYIDESGDDGIARFREPRKQGGSSRWLVISACIYRATRDADAVSWRNEIKKSCGGKTKGPVIHFADFSHAQKRAACQVLAEKPIFFTAVLTRKDVPAAQVFAAKNQLYSYLTRFVIERVSWFARDMRTRVREGDGRVKIIFSRRGGMSYDGCHDYLIHLKGDPEARIYWPVIDVDGISAESHSKMAGLQLADCGASAIAAAVEPDMYGNVEGQYLNLLARRLYERKGNYLSYGLKFLPSIDGANLTSQQEACFQAFR